MLVGTAWAVLSFFKSKDHFINLLRLDGESIKEVVFEAGKKEYVPVLQSLQNETGLQWKNLPEQRDTLRQELEGEKDNGISVELDRRVKLGPALESSPFLVETLHGSRLVTQPSSSISSTSSPQSSAPA